MRNSSITAIVGIAIIALTTTLRAQPTMPATGPATAPGAVALTATITEIKGVVQVRNAEGEPWKPATVGMKLDQGSELRTGLRSMVQFVIEPDQTVTLDRLGTLKILQAYLEPGKVTTDLGVKYGRTRYDIKAADLQHQSTIRSPGSTLAIRGTDVTYEDQVPWVPSAISREGRAEFRNYRRELVAFGGTKRATIAADKNSPAEKARDDTRLDPRGGFSGRTEAEDMLQLALTPLGGTDARGVREVQRLGRRSGFQDTFAGVPFVPGPLSFDLSWFSTSGSQLPADLNLIIIDPLGNALTAQNPTVGSGSELGQHSGNDAGTSGFGAEGANWGLFFPNGNYRVRAEHAGGEPAQIFITAFRGQAANPIASFGSEPNPAIILNPGESFERVVDSRKPPPPAGRDNTTVAAARANRTAAKSADAQRPRPAAREPVRKSNRGGK